MSCVQTSLHFCILGFTFSHAHSFACASLPPILLRTFAFISVLCHALMVTPGHSLSTYEKISSSYSASSNLMDFYLLSLRGPPLKMSGYHCLNFLPYWCLFALSFLTCLLWEMGCTYTVFAIKVHCTIRTYTSMFSFLS